MHQSSYNRKNQLSNSFDSEPQLVKLKKKSQSIERQFQMILKKSNYPYLSKLTLNRKRFFTNKRQRTDKSQPSLDIKQNYQTKSESKAKNRYNSKILTTTKIQQKNTNKKKFFLMQQKSLNQQHQTLMPTKNVSLNNRSYFLKKLKQRYQTKYQQNNLQLKIASQKVTLLPPDNSIQKQLHRQFVEDDDSEFDQQKKILTPASTLQKYSNYLSDYQKQFQLKHYNHIYYFGLSCKSKTRNGTENNNFDDQQGGYLFIQGDHIAYRFQLLGLLGQGSFGQVFKCFDHKDKKQVALKMVRNKKKYNKQAQTQIYLLKYIKENDPNMNKNLTQLKQNFIFREHTCMVFQLLSINLYQLIKLNDYYGLPLDLIRRFSLQILNGLHFLHKHEIIHADLKPENILLKQANKSGLKIIDFGSSCFLKNRIYTYIQSRYYRAPEVILGIPYDFKIDVWSFGCIVAELYLGYPILPGQNEKQQMWLMMELIGLPSNRLLQDSTRKHHYFNQKFQPLEYINSKGTTYSLMGNPLSKIIEPKDATFKKFLERIFLWQPQERLTPLQCLKHEWILQGLPQDIKKQHLKFIEQQEQILRVQKRKRSPKQKQFRIDEVSPSKFKKISFQGNNYLQNTKNKRFPSIEYKRSKYQTDI